MARCSNICRLQACKIQNIFTIVDKFSDEMISSITVLAPFMKNMIFDSFIVELLSQWIFVAPSWSCIKFDIICLIEIAWHAVDVVATSSTSIVERVTMGCFWEAHEIAPEPRWKIYPDVLFYHQWYLQNNCLCSQLEWNHVILNIRCQNLLFH